MPCQPGFRCFALSCAIKPRLPWRRSDPEVLVTGHGDGNVFRYKLARQLPLGFTADATASASFQPVLVGQHLGSAGPVPVR